MDRTLRLISLLSGLQDGAASTQDLLARVADRAGQTPAIASFYRDLKRALDAGWIEVAEQGEPEGRGRPGRVYRLSRSGRATLGTESRRLYQLASSTLAVSGANSKTKVR
jgi:DNA-binding PadR family transcriptional regulator